MNVLSILRNNAPLILSGMAIFGAAYASIEAVKATPEAIRILEEGGIDIRKEPKRAIKACYKCYIFPGVILVITSACILGIQYFNDKDKEKILAAIAYSELKHKEYLDWEKSMFGPEYPEAAQESIFEEHRKNNPIPDRKLSEGMMWCYEPESDQWFQTNTEQILWAELTANKMFSNHGSLTFNQFLSLIPDAKPVKWGDHFGWYRYDENGCWDYNWSFYPGGTPWVDIQPQIDVENNFMVLKYGMHPGDDLDCNDLEYPEQFEVKS